VGTPAGLTGVRGGDENKQKHGRNECTAEKAKNNKEVEMHRKYGKKKIQRHKERHKARKKDRRCEEGTN
jgi:hypothetical protein